jgi:predicted aminopeptidase
MNIFRIIMKLKWRYAAFAAAAALVGGCAQIGYYVQAAQGQISLLSDAKPIDDWLSDPEVGDKLKLRLAKIKEIRRFAARELGLPDNATFTSYADLKRPYVLWNVVATPELSLHPKNWCFPVAGCVNYRGYYDRGDAQAFASELRSEQYDVQVSGVPAYSTLGWFNDPVLSTFIQYPETELARLIFHELAHQMVYIPGDSRFNESFAVSVEEAGVERWIATHGNDKMRASYLEHEKRKEDFLHILLKCRKKLELDYASKTSDEEKRKRKAEIFSELQDDYKALKASWGGYAGYDRWFAEPLSNAHLALIATYHDYVPGFKALLEKEHSFPKYYEAVRALTALDPQARQQRLLQLAGKTHADDIKSAMAADD